MNKRPLKISLCIVAVIMVMVGIVWSNMHRANSIVRGLDVMINYDGCDTLVTSEDIELTLQQHMPHLQTLLVKEVDEKKVLSVVERVPYLQDCDVNVSVGRKVVVRGLQRRPIVRVFGDTLEFYMDSTGVVMPISPHNEVDVIVANGHFKNQKDLKTVCYLARYFYEHEAYKGLFDQMYMAEGGDIYLVPKVGSYVVLLGDTSDLDIKMRNLMAMYHKGMKTTGWNTYDEISLKYKNQVICRKKSK